jgi:hypothetical protein
MGKTEELINALKPIISDPAEIEKFLMENSNLPGPRANLELAFALAEIYNNPDVLLRWVTITEEQANVNNPKSFLVFSATVCLGKNYTNSNDPILNKLD